MTRFRVPDCRYFGIILLMVLASPRVSLRAQSQTNHQPPQNQSPFQLNVASNLVVVRVVVRDSQGKPVEGLQKEDFKLFDRGKEQSIAQFEAEVSALETPNPPSLATPGQPPPSVGTHAHAAPRRFLVLYFDDLDMSDSDVIDARDAADHYLATNLQPDERIAMFTSSAMLSDFTVDLKQVHDALFRLHPHPHGSTHADCPAISDYQAAEISEQDNPNMSDAWKTALDEAVNRCHMPKVTDVTTPGAKQASGDPPAPSDAAPETVAVVRNLARSILAQSEMQARTSLQGLEQVVNIVSRAPGQRSIILVSPGFLSQSEQYQLDRIIDRALHSQVVISSLDPRGLALLMREADVTSAYTPSANSGAVGSQHAVDTNREMVASDVLVEVAEGTGGQFFHNN
jgi:VWFA-related protein